MRALSLFKSLAVLAASACSGAPPLFSGEELIAMHREFEDAHNQVRETVSPAADPPLDAITHDDGLAATAQAWAQGCVFEHSDNQLGENLAFFSSDTSNPGNAVDSWRAEFQDYDYETNTCEPDAVCGHYTQLVWRTTERVGCGAALCEIKGVPSLDGIEGIFWVCNYDPPGNIVGVSPY